MVFTSVLSEQSNKSGGTHLHLIFKLGVHTKSTCHTLKEANQCIHQLTTNDIALAYLYSIGVLMIEDTSLLNSELYSTLEIVLQHVMKNDLKVGGMLIISNGNPFQLININGSSFWLSNNFHFQYDVALFNHYVRSADDRILKKILQLLRKN